MLWGLTQLPAADQYSCWEETEKPEYNLSFILKFSGYFQRQLEFEEPDLIMKRMSLK